MFTFRTHRTQRAFLRIQNQKKFESTLSFLVIDGYAQEGRRDLKEGGASTAGELYTRLLTQSASSKYAVKCDIVYPADESFQLPTLAKFDAVAWTGCSLTIHEENDARVQKQLRLATSLFDYGANHRTVEYGFSCSVIGIPQFGSCWAAQVAIVASGGICARNPRGREMGIARKIALTSEGRAHPLFEGKPTVFDAFTSHNDEITHLSTGGVKLAGNRISTNQAVAVRYLRGEFWAVQYHPEYNLHEMARLVYCRRRRLIKLGFFRDLKSADDYIDTLENLHIDPGRYDLAWKIGVDADIMDETIRLCETQNFIKHLVVPYSLTK